MRYRQFELAVAFSLALVGCRATRTAADERTACTAPRSSSTETSDAPWAPGQELTDRAGLRRPPLEVDVEKTAYVANVHWRMPTVGERELPTEWSSVLDASVEIHRAGHFVLALREARTSGEILGGNVDADRIAADAAFVRTAEVRAGETLRFAIQITRDGALHFADSDASFRRIAGGDDQQLSSNYEVSANGDFDRLMRLIGDRTGFHANQFAVLECWAWNGWMSSLRAEMKCGERMMFTIESGLDDVERDLPDDIAKWPEPVIFLLAGIFDVEEKR